MPNSNELQPEKRTNFIDKMTDKYEADFVSKLCEAYRKTFGQDNEMSEAKAKEYFQTFAESLYDKQIVGHSQYGIYSEEVRQQMVEEFYLETSALIKSLGDVAAQGCTFLWSNQNIGMFAAAEQGIREAVGVFSSGQSLGETDLGELWGKLEVLRNPDDAMGLTWDKTSQAWNAISKEFAANAEGEVHVFLPKDIGALTIFWNVELPELRKRMKPFMNPSKVTNITLHSPNDETLIKLLEIDKNTTLTEAQKKINKRELMTIPNNWESKKIQNASIEVPKLTEAQKLVLKKLNTPQSAALLEILTESNTTVKSITLKKLNHISERWRIQAELKRIQRQNQLMDKSKVIQNISNKTKKLKILLRYFRGSSSRPHQN
jgi:hypothetical protein